MDRIRVLIGKNIYLKKVLHILRKFTVVAYALLSIGIYFLIELFSRHSILEAFLFMTKSPIIFVYNAFMIFVTFMIAYFFKRRLFVTAVIATLWLAMGTANGVILSYRVTPFTGTDLTLILDAISLIDTYISIEKILLIIVGAAIVLILIIYGWFKLPKHTAKIDYRKSAALMAISVLLLFGFTKVNVSTRILATYFGNIAFAYKDYGFPYCFSMSVFATGINSPNDYSEAFMTKIKKSFTSTNDSIEAVNHIDEMPNIIFLQLESFCDPELIKYLKFSDDPIPNFRKLSEQYSSGFLTVPSVGAGTANTEFEIMTGMSLRYFGPGEYPYKTILKTTPCESTAYSLKKLGYATHAIHNNEASFYDRKTVFANLGYDTFTSEEYMNIKEYTPMGWAKDKDLVGQITDALDSTKEKDYVYTISVQGHGSYPSEPILNNPEIEVFGCRNVEQKNSFTYYVNQIHDMDKFIQELVDELSKRQEPTVLVMYGDHLPTLGLEASQLVNHSLFQTEYVIWDNMGLEVIDKSVTAYQLSATVLERIGIQEGTLTKFHQKRVGTTNYLADLDALQYDMLYGKKYIYGGELPITPTDLKMGVKQILITKVVRNLKETVYIMGKNFTKASKVYINDEEQETTFIDSSTLKVNSYNLKQGDVLKVRQINNTYGVLSTSNIYISEK
ncbi:LTA synthase family protein [Candidatus Galacturonibacter soehngenii]|uniref:Sulfatase-like hydrolase/transferase n=1 Tax=Candidatus Galacturonatibacter soehngenii TaxID=2307010 RepID=A0A7V7QNE9_9FIRM|nr:LTA synthase family protein [Candidatus Galacturonibacter soehngenii]KAB1440526.1 sulfatase-like hydrolase/transferase [Candidatus Galacturonibacter soehngenii]MBA4687779.1 sulfatase-like hydrolase/transferase [Candidatus Galacturonibacter soehngenii]